MDANLLNSEWVGFDPTDRDRIKFSYSPDGGRLYYDPIKGTLNPGNTGGDYPGGVGRSPFPYNNYAGSGLLNDGAATGRGGNIYGNNMWIPIPSTSSPANDVIGGGGNAQCPYGFYSYGGACIPGVTLDPSNPNSLVHNNDQYSKGRGVIVQVITPTKTEAGKLFQIASVLKNVGQQGATFSTKVSMPQINITNQVSNSMYIESGQQGTLLQTLSMPTTAPPSVMLQLKTDLLRGVPGGTDVSTGDNTLGMNLDATNNSQVPSPGLQLGPGQVPKPPMPPMGSQVGYPYAQNMGNPGMQYPPPGLFPGGQMPPQMPYRPSPMPFPMMGGRPQMDIIPSQPAYQPGARVKVIVAGFNPNDTVYVQLYSMQSTQGMSSYGQMLASKSFKVGPTGSNQSSPQSMTIPSSSGLRGKQGAFVASGITTRGTAYKPIQFTGGGSSGGGFLSNLFGGLFDSGGGISMGGSNGINIRF